MLIMSIDPKENEDRQDTTTAQKIGTFTFEPKKVEIKPIPSGPGEFNGILQNIKQSIEFCMEYQIDKDQDIPPAVIDALAGLHVELMEFFDSPRSGECRCGSKKYGPHHRPQDHAGWEPE